MVTIVACTGGASGRYASYQNPTGCLLQIFSPVIRLLLTHQSSVDAVACLFAILLLVQPLNWIPGVKILDTLICHLWDGQCIYWFTIVISGTVIFLKHCKRN